MGTKNTAGPGLTVGGAEVDITPDFPLPTYMGGAPRRRSRSDCGLRSNAMVFSCGDHLGAMVVLDATTVDRALVLRLRDEAEDRLGIPGGHIMVGATHSHSTPTLTTLYLHGARPDPTYVDFVMQRSIDAVGHAMDVMQPVDLAAGAAKIPGFPVNRRFVRPDGGIAFRNADNHKPTDRPESPVYPEMPFLAFRNGRGEPIAFVVSIPCHNNAMRGIRVWHRDFFGRARDVLRQRYPTLKTVLTLNGPCGNVQSSLGGDDRVNWQLGRACADAIDERYLHSETRPVSSVTDVSKAIEIPDRPFEQSTFCTDRCRGTNAGARQFARDRYGPEREAVKRRGRTSCLLELHAIAFGDTVVLGHPCEMFAQLGLRIRKKSPFGTTLISGLTDGYAGYLPAPACFRHGGYETHRSVYVGRLANPAGHVVVKEALGLLQRSKCCDSGGQCG